MQSIVYVPILKGKEGEYGALEALDKTLAKRILPLIEIPTIPFDHANDRPLKTLDAHVSGIAARLLRCWGERRPLYLDQPYFSNQDEILLDGGLAIERVLTQCADAKLHVIPVVSPRHSNRYLRAAAKHAQCFGVGGCIRLRVEDLGEDQDPTNEIDRLCNELGVQSRADLDLLIDLRYLRDAPQREVIVARYLLTLISDLQDWRRIIFASTSFPEDLSGMDAASTILMPRWEWTLRESLLRRPDLLKGANLVFGDYAIAHPDLKELDPRTMRMSASIRYTTNDGKWLLLKGRNVRQFGYQQFFDLCDELFSRPEFLGSDFSWGDEYIGDCVARKKGPGNATTWRKVGTNHHITVIARQLLDTGAA